MTDKSMNWFLHSYRVLRRINHDNLLPEITEETALIDLELDSLDIVELQMMYEDAHGVVLPDPVTVPRTVGDLMAILRSNV